MLSDGIYNMRPVCLRLVCSPIKLLILFQYYYYFYNITMLMYQILNVISIGFPLRKFEQSTFWKVFLNPRLSNQVGFRCVIKPGIIVAESFVKVCQPGSGPLDRPTPPLHPICQGGTLEWSPWQIPVKSPLDSHPLPDLRDGVERGLGLQSRLIAGVSPIAAILRRRLWASPDWCNTHQWWRQSRFTGGRVSVRQKVLIYFYVLPILSNRRPLTSGSVSKEA